MSILHFEQIMHDFFPVFLCLKWNLLFSGFRFIVSAGRMAPEMAFDLFRTMPGGHLELKSCF